jgi:hypothetical protein
LGSFLGFQHSAKTKEILANAMEGNTNSKNQPTAIPVEVTYLKTGIITKNESARKVAETLNMSNSNVMYRINKKILKPYKNRYVIKASNN